MGTDPDHATILESESPRRETRQLVDGVRQCEHALLARVLAEHAGERAIAARVGLTLAELAVGGERRAVGADHHSRMHERRPEIAFVELEEDHVAAALLAGDE